MGVEVGGGAYYPPTNIGEAEKHQENRCWRSRQAWPGLIAESVFEEKWVKEPAVFERTPRFIFRACKGAEIPTVWNGAGGDGQYDELEEPKDTWQSTPLQALWLTDAKNAPNQAITRVTLTIGGNDAGFAPIAEACWAVRREKPLNYKPAGCQKKIADEEKNLPSIKTGLPGLLKEIATRAPNAKIRVLLYPRVLNLNVEQIPVGNVPLVGAAVINNAARVGGLTAAESMALFISRLNRTVTEGVAAASLPRARVFAGTEAALDGAFGPHRLGDPSPWLNGIIAAKREESFHPSVCGHKAIARLVQGFVGPGKPIATC